MTKKKPLPAKTGVAPRKGKTPQAPGKIAPKRKTAKQVATERNIAQAQAMIDFARSKTVKRKPAPKANGRPSLYTPEVMAALCGRICEGRSLSSICDDADMPHMVTVHRWLGDIEDAAKDVFRSMYARACAVRHDRIADETVKIADTPVEAYIEKRGPLGPEITIKDATEHRRLQVDTRKWYLSKVAPHKYGDKVTQVHEGGDKPVQVETSSAEVAAAIRGLMDALPS